MTDEAHTDCADAEALGRYVEGTCSEGEREALEAHLAACGRCLAAVEAAAVAPPVPEAAGLTRAVWWALPAAAAIMIAASVVFYVTGGDPGAGGAPAMSEHARLLEAAFSVPAAGGVELLTADESDTGATELLVDPFPASSGADDESPGDARGIQAGPVPVTG